MNTMRRWKRPRVEYRRENFLRPPTSFKGAWVDQDGRLYLLGAQGDGKNWGFIDSAMMPENAIIAYIRKKREDEWVQEGETIVLKLSQDIVRNIRGRLVTLKKDEVKSRKYKVFRMFVGDGKKLSRALVLEPV